MSRSRWFVAGVVALVAAPLAVAAGGGFKSHEGCARGGGPGGHAEAALWMMDKALDEVDATAEQKTAIEDIVRDAMPELESMHDKHHDLRERFRAAMDDGADPAQLEALRVEALALADAGSRIAVDSLVEARGELTDQQWDDLQDLRDRFGHRRGLR